MQVPIKVEDLTESLDAEVEIQTLPGLFPVGWTNIIHVSRPPSPIVN
jgi:hypothetical protein